MNRHFYGRKGIVAFLCFLAFLGMNIVVPYFPVLAGQTGASEVIEKFNATLLEAMKRAKELGYEGRYKLLDPVIRESFALEYMGSVVLGRYWKTLNDNQRKLFLDTYAQWTIATYAGRFNDYEEGERFGIVSESRPEKNTVTVVSRMAQPKGDNIDFHYLLRPMAGNWRIVDIKIAGVSQLALTRAQFVSVLKLKGLDALISSMREKIKHFEQDRER